MGYNFLTEVFLAKMTSPDVAERLKQGYSLAVVPIGSIEEHGLHLPLDTDIFDCYEIVKRAAMKVADDIKPVVAPPLYYGQSWNHMDFPGSITLREETFIDVVTDICKSLAYHGFNKILIVNGHGANRDPLHAVRYRLKRETSAFIMNLMWVDLVRDVIKDTTKPTGFYSVHGGEFETSVYLYLDGDKVKMDKALDIKPKIPLPEYVSTRIIRIPLRFKEISETGAWGYATLASKEKGKKIVDAAVERLAKLLRKLKSFEWKETLKNKYMF